MAIKKLLPALAVLLSLTNCGRNKFEATPPSYLSVEEINLKTEYDVHGTSHSKINTAWVYLDGNILGVFEIPFTIPVIAAGPHQIKIEPGISMNGVGATRAIYPAFQSVVATVDFNPLDTSELSSSELEVTYKNTANVIIIEDFDKTGINLTSTGRSDTSIFKTNKVTDRFSNPQNPAESNNRAGKIVLEGEKDFFEIISVETYSHLPTSGESVYLELTYRNTMPFYVGVVANTPLGQKFAETIYIYNSTEYNKIYINIVNELVSNMSAYNFGIFMGGNLPAGKDSAYVLIDNIKLVY